MLADRHPCREAGMRTCRAERDRNGCGGVYVRPGRRELAAGGAGGIAQVGSGPLRARQAPHVRVAAPVVACQTSKPPVRRCQITRARKEWCDGRKLHVHHMLHTAGGVTWLTGCALVQASQGWQQPGMWGHQPRKLSCLQGRAHMQFPATAHNTADKRHTRPVPC